MSRDCFNFPSDIVVSGIGLATPLGMTTESTWNALLSGQTAIVPTPRGLEAPVLNFSINGARSRVGDLAIHAAREALANAGFAPELRQGQKIGCAVSQSKPIIVGHEERVDPSLLLGSFTGWSVEKVVQSELGLTGPTANIVAACATGVASIQMGAHWLMAGLCDQVLVGAAEASLHPFYRCGFQQMGVLAEGGDPARVCPFDRRRSGFAMGEGAAVLVLEKEDSTRRRGWKPLARLLTARMSHSGGDSIRFDPEGAAIGNLIKKVTAGRQAPEYVNAHGTGTPFNDAVETKGLRLGFGRQAARLAVSSTKAATGHLLGAAGAVEAAFSVLALRDQIAPPTLNLTTPDPDCDLDYVPLKARRLPLNSTLSLSYGFGGQLGAVLFGRV